MASKVLFVCVHNSARSQMAEAYLNLLGRERLKAESAGLEPGTLNPLVVKIMAEENIDISKNKTNSVFDFLKEGRRYMYVVTVCDESNGQRCPIFPGARSNLHWSFPDPSVLTGTEEEKMTEIRKIRDMIKEKVTNFLFKLEKEPASVLSEIRR